MAMTPNGYPAIPAYGDPRLRALPGITGTVADVAYDTLNAFVQRFHREVEPVDPEQSWGYAPRKVVGSTNLSNHASGTAIDLNAVKHPQFKDTYDDKKTAALRALLRDFPTVVWGGDWPTARLDQMHFELQKESTVASKMRSPIQDGWVSSEYGNRGGGLHAGTDIRARDGYGTAVQAAFAGTVEKVVSGRKHGDRSRSNELAAYRTGNGVIVRNPDGERQLYGHVKPSVKVGDKVVAGQVIGHVDDSGNTTGPHVHYEEWTSGGKTRNPRVSFRAFGVTPGKGTAPVKGSSPTPKPKPKPKPKPTKRTTLKRGMRGDDVKALQRALNEFKATPDRRWPNGDLVVDGNYGSYTQARVRDLQRRNELFVDGIAGPKTLRFLGL